MLVNSCLHCCLGGRRTGVYSDRPPSFDSGAAKSAYGAGRNDGYNTTGYGSYGSMFKFCIRLMCLDLYWCQCFIRYRM